MRRKGVVFSKMFVLRSMGNKLVPSPQMKSAKELFNQMKSVLVVKSATYTHSVMVKTSICIVVTLQTFSVNISLNRSSFERFFGLFEVSIIFLNRSFFLLIFMIIFFRYFSSKIVNP